MPRLIPDIHNFHRFRSVQFGALAAACSGALAAYAAAKAMAAEFVASVPQWSLTALTMGSMGFTFAMLVARGIDQPNLPPTPPRPPANNDLRQREG